MFVYHGMNHEAYLEFQKTGFTDENITVVWGCSNPKHMYFWYNPFGEYPHDKITNDQSALSTAIESGQIAAALSHSQSEIIHVIRLDIPEDDIECYPDYSAPNMDGALAIPKSILRRNDYPCTVLDFDNMFVPSLGLMYLVECDQSLLNINLLSETELRMLNGLVNQNIYFQDIFTSVYDLNLKGD